MAGCLSAVICLPAVRSISLFNRVYPAENNFWQPKTVCFWLAKIRAGGVKQPW